MHLRLVPLLLIVWAVYGCEKLKVTPVDVRGQAIVGYWFGQRAESDQQYRFEHRLYLHVREDGFVRYVNLLCSYGVDGDLQQRRLNLDYLPIKTLSAEKMVVQSYPLTPKFEFTLSHWPSEQSDYFEVDTVRLKKFTSQEVSNPNKWQCANEYN